MDKNTKKTIFWSTAAGAFGTAAIEATLNALGVEVFASSPKAKLTSILLFTIAAAASVYQANKNNTKQR